MSVQTREPSAFSSITHASYPFYRQEAKLREDRSGLTCWQGQAGADGMLGVMPEPEPARSSISMTLGLPQCAPTQGLESLAPQPPGPTFAVLLRGPPAVERSAAPGGEVQGARHLSAHTART